MRNGRSSRLGVALGSLACAALVAFGVSAPAAYARHAPTHVYSSTFHAPYGAPGGEFGFNSIAVDEQSGYVYLENAREPEVPLEKFTATGEPAPFTAPEANSSNTILSPGAGGFRGPSVEVDNSGNPATQGRIYVSTENPGVMAFEPNGERVKGNFPIEPGARDVAIEPGTGNIWVVVPSANMKVLEYTPEGVLTGRSFEVTGIGGLTRIAVDTHGHFYLTGEFAPVYRYTLATGSLELFGTGRTEVAVDPTTDDVYTYLGGNQDIKQFGSGGSLLFEFGVTPASTNGVASLAVNGATGWVYRGIGGNVDIFTPGPTVILPDVTTDPASDFQPTSATLHGTVNPDGETTTECYFEWGTSTPYANKTPCEQGGVLNGSPQEVTAHLTGLEKGVRYHYRAVAVNSNGTISGLDGSFTPSAPPTFSEEYVSNVHSDSVVLHGSVNPEGAAATYHFEYGTSDCSLGGCHELESGEASLGVEPEEKSLKVTGLEAGTTYYYRVVAENQSGSGEGTDHTFTTFPLTKLLEDRCPNAHVRQQTSSALLLDCRAYELVSAADAGGYDVESDLVPGQEPFGGYPGADDPSRVLYAVHDGAIPGSGNPANHGLDTYVATRGENGWTTKYVGIPSDDPNTTGPFGSPLLGADASLDTFAFGGEGICDPCFGDGTTNIPLRLPNGNLVEGMAGAQSPHVNAAGEVREPLSADGSHLVFGAEEPFAAGGPSGGLGIYDRDLSTGSTQLVSTDAGGAPLTGTVAELAVSANGERILIGKKVGEDADGNESFDLYMHIGADPHAVVVAETPDGVVFNGMTSDGGMVFFTTRGQLAGDTDTSADFYRADVGDTSPAPVTRLSTGTEGAGNTDSCTPVTDWNVVAGGPSDCSTVAIAGGGGIASGEGTAYFLSPELLDSAARAEGEENQPNLYVSRPGQPPRFVATIDSSAGKPLPPPPSHPLSSPSLVSGLSGAASLTVDQSNGDLYVIENGGVSRYTSAGAPDDFTEGSGAGSNKISVPTGGASETEIAVDNAPGAGPLAGAFYVPSNAESVSVFSSSGKKLGELSGFAEACGVAVDESNGDLYVGDYGNEGVWRLEPSSPAAPIENSDYVKTGILTTGVRPCNVGVDTAGNVFADGWSTGPLVRYSDGDFAPTRPEVTGTEVSAAAFALATDPESNELFIDEGAQIAQLAADGTPVQSFGSGALENSYGVAINGQTKHIYALNGSRVVEFGNEVHPYRPIADPAVVHGVEASATRHFEDFQVTPDGRYAAFSSVLPLTGYDNGRFSEVFRYDAQEGSLVCASCNPTNARAVGASTLPRDGLGLAEDGHVFFDSGDAIAPRDLDGRVDAYEYEGGKVQLISTGASPFDSRMLGISANGRDAYFFTHDTLVPQDENGDLVKIYDARVEGGFPYVPPPVPCRASDECHGRGTEAPPPPKIPTIRGTSGNEAAPSGHRSSRCGRHRVMRHGRCVKGKRRHHRHHRRHERGRRKHRGASRQG